MFAESPLFASAEIHNGAAEVLKTLMDVKDELVPIRKEQAEIRKRIAWALVRTILLPLPAYVIHTHISLQREFARHRMLHAKRRDIAELAREGLMLLGKLELAYSQDDLLKEIFVSGRELFSRSDLNPP